ncbi:MAG: hypothetical protein HYV07_24480 [Deltaproteobacteria bacterium]|nr:hypothetical protein [Deltaproteobacteria bacterium]
MARLNLGTFSIEASDQWTLSTMILAGPVEEPNDKLKLKTAKPPKPFQQNIIVTMEQVKNDETPESYVKRQIQGLVEANVRRKETASPENVELAGGQKGYLTEQSVTAPGGEQVRQLQLVTIKKGVAFTLIASNLDGPAFDASRTAFRKILTSFAAPD